ncbi:hypothetical protein PACTADRAFT_48090 [Pachysolen tannophilus NRRL Y-2460]|uniref:RRM domain-containing protein n=1 Tax=Pachysolen tannophilus NRRL Y-2460 TaxID=669874 RepID=A0A1E4U2S1_PACTA|nr:hypothetical protein PACTADRAFT_48090 [Pachysolen tannophilus NRRL Y-2460]
MSDIKPSKVIYVGSIPYDQTEEQVLEIAKSVGPVVDLKLLFDKETGKSKGYAFVEYSDLESAQSAVRNLSRYNIGNRTLKCNFSNETTLLNGNNNNNNNVISGTITDSVLGDNRKKIRNNKFKQLQSQSQSQSQSQTIPPLPPGIELSNNAQQSASDVITTELNKLDRKRLLNLVKDAKKMSTMNPTLMKTLLKETPQLSYALVEAALLLGLTGSSQLQTLLVDDGKIDQLQQQKTKIENKNKNKNNNKNLEELTLEQRELIKEVINMSDDQVNILPDDKKSVILQLKALYGNNIV